MPGKRLTSSTARARASALSRSSPTSSARAAAASSRRRASSPLHAALRDGGCAGQVADARDGVGLEGRRVFEALLGLVEVAVAVEQQGERPREQGGCRSAPPPARPPRRELPGRRPRPPPPRRRRRSSEVRSRTSGTTAGAGGRRVRRRRPCAPAAYCRTGSSMRNRSGFGLRHSTDEVVLREPGEAHRTSVVVSGGKAATASALSASNGATSTARRCSARTEDSSSEPNSSPASPASTGAEGERGCLRSAGVD